MDIIVRFFIRGLLAFLPAFLTLWAIYHIVMWLNHVSATLLQRVLPELAGIPGLGIVLGFGAILLLGILVSSRLTRWIYQLAESPFRRVPIIRELYVALKQLTDFLSPKRGDDDGQVVSVKHPDLPLTMIGLLMREDVDDLGLATADDDDLVGVYLPMSYQIGGYTLFVPRRYVRHLDMSVEVALRETLTGWMRRDDTG